MKNRRLIKNIIVEFKMSMFKKSLRALGFTGVEDEEQKPVMIDNTVKKSDGTEQLSPVRKEDIFVELPKQEIQAVELPDVLLDGIMAMINDSLPSFVKDCLDREAEKQYIYNLLATPLNDYIHQITVQTRESSIKDLNEVRKNLETETAELKNRIKETDTQKEELQRLQLSAERQKRALSDKVHELEMRAVTLEAEKEQLELEGKSLLNKLKVSNIHQEGIDTLQQENNRLLVELNELKSSQIPQEKWNEIQGKLESAEKEKIENSIRISELTEQLAASGLEVIQAEELEAALETAREDISEKEKVIEQLNISLEKLAEKNENAGVLQDELHQAEEKMRIQSQQFSEWQLDTEKRMEQMTDELKKGYAVIEEKEHQISELNILMETLRIDGQSREKNAEGILAEKETRILQLSEELEEANVNLEVVHEVQEKLNQFEQIKLSKEQKITQLNSELNSAHEEIERLTRNNELVQSRLEEQIDKLSELKLQTDKPAENREDTAGLREELSIANDMLSALKLQRQGMLADMETLKKERDEWKAVNGKINLRIEELERSEKQLTVQLKKANKDAEKWQEESEVKSSSDRVTDEDNYDDLNWLLPVPPDSAETIAKRKEEEERKRKEEEEAEATRKIEAKPDPSQMSLW